MIGTTEDRVRAVVAEYIGKDRAAITAASRLDEEIATDSLERIEILMQIEDEFEVEIQDDDALKLVTIGDAIALVERLVEAKKAAP